MTGFSFAGQWYIEPGYAKRMEDIIVPRLEAGKDPIPFNMLEARTIDMDALKIKSLTSSEILIASSGQSSPRLSRYEQYVADCLRTPEGVGIIPVSGAMSRSGEMCSYGNETLARWSDILSRDENTRAVVYKMNTPGGTVDSTRMFADTVKMVSAAKPTVAWTPFCASAGIFVASQCTEIMVEDQIVGGIGSIGVLMILVNQAAALEKQGIQVEIIRADGSQDKALVNGIEPVSDQTRAEIKATLNDCRSEFVGYVRRGRAGKLKSEDVFTGKMYSPNEAVKQGLADRKGSFQQAIQRAITLSK